MTPITASEKMQMKDILNTYKMIWPVHERYEKIRGHRLLRVASCLKNTTRNSKARKQIDSTLKI